MRNIGEQPSAQPESTSASRESASSTRDSEPADPSTTTAVAAHVDLGSILEAPFVPTDVDVVLDADRLIEAVIPLEGGTVSVTGADGTVYSLEIPPGALLSETRSG